jgi:D-alanyl-D-alanine dipeptidase
MLKKKSMILLYPILIGFVAAIAIFYILNARAQFSPEYIGEGSLYLLKASSEAQKALLYIDQSAKLAAYDSINELEKKGLNTDCGEYLSYDLWNSKEQDCFPDKNIIKKNLKEIYGNILDNYLIEYQDLYIPISNYHYQIRQKQKSLEIMGYANNHLKIGIKEGAQTREEQITNYQEELREVEGDCGDEVCLLKAQTALIFKKAQKIAKEQGIIIKATSAYRSPEKQRDLWIKNKKDCRIVCCPRKGSFKHCPHVTGNVVDISVKNLNTGPYKAYHSYQFTEEQKKNHDKIVEIMTQAGFVGYANKEKTQGEWWHFEYKTTRWARAKQEEVNVII